MTVEQVRMDLKDIQYYYANKELFDLAAKTIGRHHVCEIADKYNEIIRKAPPRLYDLYVRLYLMNNTQEMVAEETNYATQTIALNCQNLTKYLFEELNKMED